jgi:guanosine-3',5'-bis(diphosphate) 3'-pyrophosphohydrolase
MTAKRARGPSRDWLNPHLGYVKTSHSKEKIRQWFKKQERTENIENGRALLDKELQHLGLKNIDRDELAKSFKYDSLDDFLAAIGYGEVTTHQIALKIAAQQEPSRGTARVALAKPSLSAIQVLGVGDLLTQIAGCCHPVPGDKIVGYITRSRGVTIHRQDCYNVVNESEKERLVPVEWQPTDSRYSVNVQVEGWDRVGLMRDITTIVAEEKVNIASVQMQNHDDHTVTLYFTLETEGLAQLSRLLFKVEGVRGVINVARIGGEVAKVAPAAPPGSVEKT